MRGGDSGRGYGQRQRRPCNQQQQRQQQCARKAQWPNCSPHGCGDKGVKKERSPNEWIDACGWIRLAEKRSESNGLVVSLCQLSAPPAPISSLSSCICPPSVRIELIVVSCVLPTNGCDESREGRRAGSNYLFLPSSLCSLFVFAWLLVSHNPPNPLHQRRDATTTQTCCSWSDYNSTRACWQRTGAWRSSRCSAVQWPADVGGQRTNGRRLIRPTASSRRPPRTRGCTSDRIPRALVVSQRASV